MFLKDLCTFRIHVHFGREENVVEDSITKIGNTIEENQVDKKGVGDPSALHPLKIPGAVLESL